MTYDELRRAIELPAQQGNWEFEDGLVDLLLEEVNEEPGALPLHAGQVFRAPDLRRTGNPGFHDRYGPG